MTKNKSMDKKSLSQDEIKNRLGNSFFNYNIKSKDFALDEDITDSLIFSLILKDIRWFKKLENNISENLYYMIMAYIYYGERSMFDILMKCNISKKLENFLINMYENYDKTYNHLYIIKDSFKMESSFIFIQNFRSLKLFEFRILARPQELNLKVLAMKLATNPNISVKMLNTVYGYMIKSKPHSDHYSEHYQATMDTIEAHPKFSMAKFLLEEVQKA